MVTVLPPAGDLRGSAEVLRGRRRAQAGVGAVPQRDVMRAQNAVDGVGEVLGLQIRELRLLLAELHVEQVVVDLRDQRLQRHRALDARGSRPAARRCCAGRRSRKTRRATESPAPQSSATGGRWPGPA